MCVDARRGLAICLVLAATIGTKRVFAGDAATQPARDSQFLVPDFTAAHPLNASVDARLSIEPRDELTPTDSQAPTPPSARIDTISDPLPPALWSGVVMLGLAMAFLSIRQLRRLLR